MSISRYMFEKHRGAIPDKLCVLHHCDNRMCINPDHLFLGTRADNMADKLRKGRQTRGEDHYVAKLTEKQALRIKYKDEEPKLLAKELNISTKTVSDIRIGKSWKHI